MARIPSATAGEIVVESTIRPGPDAVLRQQAADDLLDVARAGDHREDDVAVGQFGGGVDDRRADALKVVRLLARPVVDADLMACIEQPLDEGPSHPPDTHPAKARHLVDTIRLGLLLQSIAEL